jgi:hypothetical protein
VRLFLGNAGRRALWASGLAVALALLLLPFGLAAWLGRGVEPLGSIAVDTPADAAAVEHLQAGIYLERQGRLSEAIIEYRTALAAEDGPLRDMAEAVISRVRQKQSRHLPAWLGLTWSQLGGTLADLWPLFSLACVATVVGLLRQHKGIELRTFSVFGSKDAAASDAFREYLLSAFGEHQRIATSHLSRFIGGVPVGDLLRLTWEGGDAWSRALESAKTGELKAVVSFSLGEMLRFVRSRGQRPAYVISGQVCCLPGRTVATAELRGTRQKAFLLRGMASSAEYPPLMTGPRARAAAGDELLLNEQLSQVATVLAAKLWHSLAQKARADLRPKSWLTVLRLSRALRLAERL